MPNEFLTRFEVLQSFQKSTKAFEELRAEARRDFVALWPLQARIRERVQHHIEFGPSREYLALSGWKHNQAYIEIPANVIKSIATIPGGWNA